ncbi:hypothetical protein J1605_016617 [Eschrichtius robustus]|uniref:Uncharacterized protein n=1 Tax=Eschrichtius robustus TaxID=9764 RepID=A0AB34I893_ESCRO|nr:hypothetical protein J1605_016617 [Eschrichtius robustus]
MQPCKEFYKSPLGNVGTLPGQDFSHSTPEFPGAGADPHSFLLGYLRHRRPFLYSAEACGLAPRGRALGAAATAASLAGGIPPLEGEQSWTITQVSKAEVGQDSGPRRGARGLGSWGAGPPGAARSPARRRLGESSSAPRGPGPLFGALITRERLPRGFCGRTGAGGLAAGGSSGLGLATSPPSPPPAAGG